MRCIWPQICLSYDFEPFNWQKNYICPLKDKQRVKRLWWIIQKYRLLYETACPWCVMCMQVHLKCTFFTLSEIASGQSNQARKKPVHMLQLFFGYVEKGLVLQMWGWIQYAMLASNDAILQKCCNMRHMTAAKGKQPSWWKFRRSLLSLLNLPPHSIRPSWAWIVSKLNLLNRLFLIQKVM